MPLTDVKIRTAKPSEKPYRLSDGRGLCLEVRPTGSKFWRYSYRHGGKQSMLTIGEYPFVSLSDARRLLEDARESVAKGIDPNAKKAADKLINIQAHQNTFSVVADEWYSSHAPHWKRSTVSTVRRNLDKDILPFFGELPISMISPAMILGRLREIEERGSPETAKQIRQRISAIMEYAIVTLRIEMNPAASLKGAIKSAPTQHTATLPVNRLGSFRRALAGYKGLGLSKQAVYLLIYTMARTIEVRFMEWPELDLDRAEWRIPGSKMKNGENHIVPLPRQAVVILRELQDLSGRERYVFPNTRDYDRPMSASTVNSVIHNIGFKGCISGHGFRGTASTILHEQGYRTEVIERALAHTDGNTVRAAYNHALYLEERRKLLQDWADFFDAQ
ncbi:tyrosine-type recombinase/integrase [Chromobacterium violaceum]|uniref:tyrosine-type recombinase/integrase n=1 Tax=Chromobacterium violaceum TaxID=536 RepID=UPI0005BCB65B|nr:integrase arm-type DNA-binding domain-containing protein [Chromobacterium violaceum]